MEFWLSLAGLGMGLAGAVAVAVGDAWLSRSVLVYLDAIEANVAQLAKVLTGGEGRATVTGFDLKRDRGQDRARALKVVGWLTLALGFAAQILAAWLAKFPL